MAARLGAAEIGTGTVAAAPERRQVRINSAPASVNSLSEWLSVLWLTPAMDRLFTGSASERRRFLDRLVLALEPDHAHHSSRYEAAMRARNKLLADERVNFRNAVRSLSNAVTLVAEFAHENRQELVRSLNQSSDVMETLLSRKPQLNETLRVMPVALQNLKAILRGDRLLVRVDPTVILPGVAGLVDQLCSVGTAQLCAAFGPSLANLNNLLALLGLGGNR